ncbi:radical SAM protein [candidate division CSSED10-310 bacterium]|uniref:Radical SAM protein n=1 Tax=candidate division CSSED10-310 bacterium TaxID=2855610 RepID=A0ABV6YX43_UNCC1
MDSLTYLTLIITYQCSSRCEHCCIGAGPEHREWMLPEDAGRYISAVTKNNSINWMTLIGGEALLDLERTIKIGKLALGQGIPKVEIDTGASWGSNEHTTRDVLQQIVAAGLSLGAISIDSFHQQHVKPEYVLRLLRTARDLGIELKGSSAVLQSGPPANPYDVETDRIRQWFEDHGFRVESSPVVLQGRAVNLARYHTGARSIPLDRCAGVPFFATTDWSKPGGIAIDVFGSVMLEHGICIGNARKRELSEILKEYHAGSHPIISVLMKEGPIGLTRLPQAAGFMVREDGYVDKCHLCQDIRTYLRPFFPEILGPENYYPPIPDREASNNSWQVRPKGSPD